jgi:hypothetical protein
MKLPKVEGGDDYIRVNRDGSVFKTNRMTDGPIWQPASQASPDDEVPVVEEE